jgi:hypothetical protein
MDNNFFIILIVYLYLFGGLYCIFLSSKGTSINRYYIGIIGFIFTKSFFNYRKCTVSYAECKIRNVKKEEGYLYRFLDSIIDLRYSLHSIILNILSLIIMFYFYVLKKNEF